MGFLTRLVSSFIGAYGITQPSEKQARTATIFISGLIFLIALAFIGVALFLALHFLR